MGTNYYHHHEAEPPCQCCGRPYHTPPDHIGSASAGWMFSWCGLRHRSVKEWETALRAGGWIEDEYGARQDVEGFIAFARGQTGAREYDSEVEWRRRHGQQGVDPEEEWLDPEGHDFYAGEFE